MTDYKELDPGELPPNYFPRLTVSVRPINTSTKLDTEGKPSTKGTQCPDTDEK